MYCSGVGFASGGPDADSPAYDDIIQARSGLAALNEDAEGAPQFVRTIACDKIVGLHLALAITAGVIKQQREGQGTAIEVPMLESMAAFLMAEHLAGHTLVPAEGDLGYERLFSGNRKPYKTLDGYTSQCCPIALSNGEFSRVNRAQGFWRSSRGFKTPLNVHYALTSCTVC